MDIVTLRRAGGSLTLTIPKSLVRALGLLEGAQLGVSIEDGKLVAEPATPPKPSFTLEELLEQCDFDAPLSDEEREWLDDPPVGRELI